MCAIQHASKFFSLSGSGMFLFASSNFISPPLQQSQKSNIDDWLHFITAGFIFQKDLQVHPDNGAKAEIRRVLTFGMGGWVLPVRSCFEMLDYAEWKRIFLLSRDAAVQFILGTEVPWPPRLRKKPVSPSTRVVIHQQHRGADNQGIKAGQEKSCLQT